MPSPGMLSEHFSEDEFRCKCGCGICNVEPLLIMKLEMLRRLIGRPIKINSGCRCRKYNDKVGGEKGSKHLTTLKKPGRAADIHCPLDDARYEILKHAVSLSFRGIGIDRSFIHLDVRDADPVCWTY